jgi:hypothetical protein
VTSLGEGRGIWVPALLALACAGPPRGTPPVGGGDRPWFTAATAHFELFAELPAGETARLATGLEQGWHALPAAAWPLGRRYAGPAIRVVVVPEVRSFGGSGPGAAPGVSAWQPGVRPLHPAPLVMLDASPGAAAELARRAIAHLSQLMRQRQDPHRAGQPDDHRTDPLPPAPAAAAATGLQPTPLPLADVRAVRALLYLRAPGPLPPAERERRARGELAASLALDPLGARALEFGWPLLDAGEARVRARASFQARPWAWRAAVLAASVAGGAEAVTILERAAAWHPGHRHLEAALALAYWEAGRYPDARRLARQAVDRDPGDPDLLGVYGQCLIAGSACEDGREAIAAALAGAAGGQLFPYDLGWLERTCGLR